MKTSQRDELQSRRSTGMRSKLNLAGSADQRIGMSGVRISRMPMEWLDSGSWRLPSGKALAEFALQAGFLAPLLLKADRFGGAACGPARGQNRRQPMPAPLAVNPKHFRKGAN